MVGHGRVAIKRANLPDNIGLGLIGDQAVSAAKAAKDVFAAAL
jgi:hypothetical protein